MVEPEDIVLGIGLFSAIGFIGYLLFGRGQKELEIMALQNLIKDYQELATNAINTIPEATNTIVETVTVIKDTTKYIEEKTDTLNKIIEDTKDKVILPKEAVNTMYDSMVKAGDISGIKPTVEAVAGSLADKYLQYKRW